jgi:hypothetical protein
MVTMQRVQNYMDTIKQFKNPNQIPANVLAMLNADLATIMQGGVAHQGALHELDNETYAKSFSKLMSKIGNKVTPANAGEFVKLNSGIMQSLLNGAKDRLEKRNEDVGNTYGSLGVSPEAKESFRQAKLPNHIIDQNGKFVKKSSQPIENTGAPALNADLDNMTPEQLQSWIATHGGQ